MTDLEKRELKRANKAADHAALDAAAYDQEAVAARKKHEAHELAKKAKELQERGG
jgi:hypothetical protein